jgi:RHS repeat-associated protein
VVAEKQGSTWTKSYVYLDGLPVAQCDNTVTPNTTFFVHKDHLGSTRLLTKMNKSVQQCLDYYPFGETETSSCTTPGSSTTAHQFTGKERDTESGLDNFLARSLVSGFGRFMSVDPGNRSGLENQDDPQGWNAYAYVRNNPGLYVDPDGHGYYVCVDTDEGQNCFYVAEDRDFWQMAYGSPGVSISGGKIYVTNENGDAVQIGTYEHFGPNTDETLGVSDDPILFPAILGAVTGAVTSGVRGLLGL